MAIKRLIIPFILAVVSVSLLSSCSKEEFIHASDTYENSKIRVAPFISQSGELETLSEYMRKNWIAIINKTKAWQYEAYTMLKDGIRDGYVRQSTNVPKDLPLPKILIEEDDWTFNYDWSPAASPKDFRLVIKSKSDRNDGSGVSQSIGYLQIYRHEKSRKFIQYENVWWYTSEFQIWDNWTIGYPCIRETCGG